MMQPNVFESTGKVQVRQGTREVATPDSALDPDKPGGGGFALTDELHILSSPVVYDLVLADLGPSEILAPPDPAKLDEHDLSTPTYKKWLHRAQSWWFVRAYATGRGHPENCRCEECMAKALEKLQGNTTIGIIPRSNMIAVTVKATSPLLAQKTANAFLKAFDRCHRDYFSSTRSLDWLNEQTQRLVEAAEKAERALADFREQHEIFDLSTQETDLYNQVSDLGKQIAANRGSLAATDDLIKSYTEALSHENEYDPQDLTNNPVPNPDRAVLQEQLKGYREQLERLRREFREDSTLFKSRSPPILKQIADTEEQISKTPPFLEVTENTKRVRNPNYQVLRDRLDSAIRHKLELEKPTAEMEKQLVTLKERLDKLRLNAFELNRLEAEAKSQRDKASQAQLARNRTENMNLLDRAEMGNLKIASLAVYPTEKVAPDRGKILAIGAAMGLFGGIALAFVRKILDRTIRQPADVTRFLGVRVIGIVPETRRWRTARRLARRRVPVELN
jgi:uncharacterized protein involved in exopolysaccharide biosynthesis